MRVAMDAAASGGFARRTKRPQRTAKSCGPGAATVASIRPACAGLATVTINAAHRGEHEGNRSNHCAGKAGMFWLNLWWLTGGLFLLPSRLRVRLAPGLPCALSAKRDNELSKLRRNRVVRMIPAVVARLDRATQYSRDFSD